MTNTPSETEIDNLLCKHWPGYSRQAVLVKMWLREAIESAIAKWGTPQPVVREPLSVQEVEQLLAQWSYEVNGDRARYLVRMTEAAHGIKQGGQHGTESST